MNWRAMKLGDVTTNIQTGPFGSQLHMSDYSEVGTPFIMPKDIKGGKIDAESVARIGDDHVARLSRHKFSEGDIVFPRRGDVGKCALITENESGWVCGSGCFKVTLNRELVNPRFVAMQLTLPAKVEWLEKNSVGATMPNINSGIIGSLPVEIPELHKQIEIVSIISVYDKLIENSRKQINLLEEADQRLYKEWFVDMRFPGHEDIPIIDGVPEGWSKKSLTDLLEIKYGKDHKSLPDGEIPVYGSGGIMRFADAFSFDGESVLIPRKGSLNNIMLVKGKFWAIDTMFYSTPKVANVNKICYFHLRSLDMNALNVGAALPSMTTKILSHIQILCATDSVLETFENIVDPMFKMIEKLRAKCEQLESARDALLPKLMSGILEVASN